MILRLLLLLQIIFLSWLVVVPLATAAPSMALPNCIEMCGNVFIPYPFGVGKGCYRDEWYAITCNNSFNPKKPFLSKLNLELSMVDMENMLVTVNIPVTTAISNCPRNHEASNFWTSTNVTGSPFNFSSTSNEFTVVGCDNALLTYKGEIMAGCTSACITGNSSVSSSTKACYGIDCCQTSIPNNLDFYSILISGNNTRNCTYAFLAQNGWYPMNLLNRFAIYEADHVPVVMDWRPFGSEAIITRFGGKSPSYNCFSPPTEGYYACECGWAYEGNPFIQNGCTVGKACAPCKSKCARRHGGDLYCNNGKVKEILLGTFLGGGLGLILLCGFSFWLYKYSKRRQRMKLKKKFFENQVRLLQQQISSDGGTVQKTVVFSSKELEKVTDNFNENRILGQGGQGTVYKGMLTDGKIIAIKKSKVVEESQMEQFINEVVILSQINHRNIVKLLGCCLETDVPLLVYEFVSNGNLFELIRDQNEEFPLSWKMRLQIASEVAGALAYLHSSSSSPIYHRDIKSTNILLDEKFRAKVADFGTSRSIPIEQTHLTTLVHGTFGYLDPEYFQSSQFTDKSDVYSFGVVLAELLTGQKAISSIITEEERSLAARFILCLKEMRLFDLVDARIIGEARKEEIILVAEIAKRCLNLLGKNRPTMMEVMMELEGIRMSHKPLTVPQHFNKDESSIEMSGPVSAALTSIHSSVAYHRAFSSQSDDHALLINTV